MFHHASARCPSERFYNPYIHKHSPDGIAMSSANPNAISDDVVQEPLPPPPLAISAAGRLCNAIVRRRRRAAKSIQMAALGKCGATQLLKNPPRSQCPAPPCTRVSVFPHTGYMYIYIGVHFSPCCPPLNDCTNRVRANTTWTALAYRHARALDSPLIDITLCAMGRSARNSAAEGIWRARHLNAAGRHFTSRIRSTRVAHAPRTLGAIHCGGQCRRRHNRWNWWRRRRRIGIKQSVATTAASDGGRYSSSSSRYSRCWGVDSSGQDIFYWNRRELAGLPFGWWEGSEEGLTEGCA